MILVTGATGQAGSAVIREFARQGYPVKALVRSRAKAQALETWPSVEVIEGDMLLPETLTEALSGVDRVLLISSSDATGATVRYINIPSAERKRALLAAGVPAYVVDALDVQAGERRKGANGEAVVHLETHSALGLRPTPFAEFARHHAADFRGELVHS